MSATRDQTRPHTSGRRPGRSSIRTTMDAGGRTRLLAEGSPIRRAMAGVRVMRRGVLQRLTHPPRTG
jgi:hypothetical protein